MRPETLGSLEDIRDSAQHIADDIAGLTYDAFVGDRRVRQLVERNLEIIGEAVNRLQRKEPAIADQISSYRKVIGLRNQIIHAYDNIDYELVWQIIQEFLPILKTEVEQLLDEAQNS
jgi:uncharacterized protein with HEPN domain